MLIVLVNAGVWGYGYFELKKAQDQNCVLFERNAADAVKQVNDSYKFFSNIVENNPDETDSALVAFALPELPKTEQRAADLKAPPNCDQPNVGLDEPNEQVLARPNAVVKLYEKQIGKPLPPRSY